MAAYSLYSDGAKWANQAQDVGLKVPRMPKCTLVGRFERDAKVRLSNCENSHGKVTFRKLK